MMMKYFHTLAFALSATACHLSTAHADQVILDDLIVTESACIGPNCLEDMDFGFSTLVIDGTDPSLLFSDTSVAASFPTADWQVGVNSGTNTFAISSEGLGQDVFAISEDGDAVAIGAGATLASGTVSIGNLRLANAADGVAPTDAVTLGQLNAAVAALPTDFSAALTANAANSARLTQLSQEIDAVGAIGSAMSALQVNPRATGDHFVSFGLGAYEGTSAFAVGSFHFLANDTIFVNTGAAWAAGGAGGTAARLGVTFGR